MRKSNIQRLTAHMSAGLQNIHFEKERESYCLKNQKGFLVRILKENITREKNTRNFLENAENVSIEQIMNVPNIKLKRGLKIG